MNKYYNNGSWNRSIYKYWNGSSWVKNIGSFWDGGNWTPINEPATSELITEDGFTFITEDGSTISI